MSNEKAPQIFHNKDTITPPFVMFPNELFAAVNHLFNGNEAKIMLALLGCTGDGSFSPSAKYMLQMTGISKRENYFRARKQLIDKGYIQVTEGALYIDTGKVLEDYRSLFSKECKNNTSDGVKIA